MEKNPFVQAGALSTDLGEIPHASPFPTPFDQAGGIDGGVDQLKESCRFIPLCQILKATNDFDDALVVGTGGFGKVYEANIDDGATTTVVAIKRLSAVSNQGTEQFWTEVKLLSKFRHANLISLIGYCNKNQEMIIVYKYMAKGTLADHLYKTSREENGGSSSHLTWEQRLNICLDTACGLDYLQNGNGTLPGIIHRDVKSTNILLDKYLVAKVSDFGISKSMTTYLTTHVSTSVKGTFGYLDPDYFLTCRLTKKSDVYAFGVVLLEVLCGRPAIDTRLDEKQINLVNWAKINIKKGKLDRIIDPSLNGDITPHTGRPPDQHGEKNSSPTCKTLSTNGQTEMENEFVGHLEETNEFLLDFVEAPNEAGVSSESEFQLKNQWSRFSAYPNSDGPVVPHPHMASTQILGGNMEGLGDLRNLFASPEEPLLQGHVSGSMWTVPPCLDQAPSRLMPTIAHTMGSSDDLRNLLSLVGEPFSTGHVSGSIDWTVPPCLDQAPSQLMPTIAHTTESSDDLRNLLPLVGEPFLAGHVSRSINRTVPPCSVPAPSQPMPTIAHTMGNSDDLRNLLALVEEPFPARQAFGSVSWTGPSCSDPALSQLMPTIPHTMPTIPRMVPLLTERQDTRSVKLRATYGDTTIQFNLPLTSGIRELNKEVLKRLEFELGRFKVEYEDEDGVLILIACDDDVRDYLQFLTSSGNQDRMMEELHSRGKTIEEIEECLRRVPMNPSVISAIRKAHSLPRCELRIISGVVNQFFIETILKQYGLFDCLTEIITSPSTVEEGEGRLRIFPYHSSPHGCSLCPPNLCKLGDGDQVMPRKDFPLWKRICDYHRLIKAKFYEWSNGEDPQAPFKATLKLLFTSSFQFTLHYVYDVKLFNASICLVKISRLGCNSGKIGFIPLGNRELRSLYNSEKDKKHGFLLIFGRNRAKGSMSPMASEGLGPP
ncbi:hypothetical protein RHGRI_038698 [Rhododendron griersonianum]|uniref:Protein kinase domain-containing protein n=1 Tax=Rhododendron griersonianum TaxID=479676 RepID=A0AAV6HMI4_9ERIC|nr:hypothetical protein RHGRI_038698 [Rhododendron griersonianum]